MAYYDAYVNEPGLFGFYQPPPDNAGNQWQWGNPLGNLRGRFLNRVRYAPQMPRYPLYPGAYNPNSLGAALSQRARSIFEWNRNAPQLQNSFANATVTPYAPNPPVSQPSYAPMRDYAYDKYNPLLPMQSRMNKNLSLGRY